MWPLERTQGKKLTTNDGHSMTHVARHSTITIAHSEHSSELKKICDSISLDKMVMKDRAERVFYGCRFSICIRTLDCRPLFNNRLRRVKTMTTTTPMTMVKMVPHNTPTMVLSFPSEGKTLRTASFFSVVQMKGRN